MAQVKVYFTFDDGRRGALTVDETRKDGLIGALVHNATTMLSEVPVAERQIGFMKAVGALAASAGERVSDEITKERVETACENAHWNPGHPCEWALKTPAGQLHCGRCGCNLSATEKLLPNLARMAEKRDKDGKITVGCKHPERNQGKGWKR